MLTVDRWPAYPSVGGMSMGPPTCYALIDFDGGVWRIPVYHDAWHPADQLSVWPGGYIIGHRRAFDTQMSHNIADYYRPEGLDT